MTLTLRERVERIADSQLPDPTLPRLNRTPRIRSAAHLSGNYMIAVDVIDAPEVLTGARLPLRDGLAWWGASRLVTENDDIPKVVSELVQDVMAKLLEEK